MKRWRSVAGFSAYEVSDDGEVRRVKPPVDGRRCALPRTIQPQQEWTGYISVRLVSDTGEVKVKKVHRLVAEAFIGAPPSPEHEIAHYDGSRSNNHVSNLRWATRKENLADRLRHGTVNHGERHGHSRLTNEVVLKVRAMRAAGIRNRDVASQLGISRVQVTRITKRERWMHI